MRQYWNQWIILGTVPLSLAWSAPASATFYPNHGDFYHNGYSYMNSHMLWREYGPFLNSDPGYEHDLNIYPTFYSSCTSWTNLPDRYDDCSTAGVLDGTYHAFSFGSYDAKKIRTYRWYLGTWSFSGGSGASSTPIKLFGQETAHLICPFDLPWCMDGVRTVSDPEDNAVPFVWGTLVKGTIQSIGPWNIFPWNIDDPQ